MTERSADRDIRMLSPQQLIAWAEDNTETMRLRTARDVLPGGYMAAMAPVLVDWQASEPYGDDPYVVLRNVNYGGNPLEKTTILHSVRVPLAGVEFAEFTLVPLSLGGLRAPAHHGQLRFVFKPGKQPELLRLAGSQTGTDASIQDLVLSWESWHGTDERFNLIKGLDTAAYGLTQRAFAGPQRFLEDTLRGLDWFSFRLHIPGAQEGLTDLLKVTVALGDGVARRTISQLLERGEADWLEHAPPGEDDQPTQREWQMLQQHVQYSGTNNPVLHLPQEQQTYHTLLRSCATLARYSVLVTAKRMVNRGHTDGLIVDKLPEPVLGKPEAWMGEVARANLRGIFLRAPMALAYVLRHPESVPAKIPEELTAAGLVELKNGRARMVHYSHSGIHPYGPDGINPV